MPALVRRRGLMPIMSRPTVRGVLRILSQPVICTLHYAGTLYAWQVPAGHDAALLDGALHYFMHVTMLASGLLVFWRVFDPRPSPWGEPFHPRPAMLGAAIFANIPLGAITTLKDKALYTAYDQLGRWWGVEPMNAERLGGLVIWIPASMMGLFVVLWLVALWGRTDARQDIRRQQGFRLPRDAEADPIPGVAERAARRRMGWGLAIVPLAVGGGLVVLALWLAASKALPPH